MTPWERLDAEIARKRSSWSSLAAQLDVKKQAVGNWKARGIPAKHMRAAAAFVGKSMDWLEFGEDAPSNMQWQTVADAKAKDKWERKECGK